MKTDQQTAITKAVINNASETVKALNPHLFNRSVVCPKPEQPAVRSLVKGVQKPAGRAPCMGIRVTIISCRRKLLDEHDNGPYAHKPLVDAIAATLGIDDASPNVTWEYGQVISKGEPTTIVKIEMP